MEDDGYASVEENMGCSGEMGSERTFEVTDRGPTTTAQWLFLMEWNGDTRSYGEDVEEIESIPSDGETNDMEVSERGCGSIHTLESLDGALENRISGETPSGELDTVPAWIAPASVTAPPVSQFGNSLDYITPGHSSRPMYFDVTNLTNIYEIGYHLFETWNNPNPIGNIVFEQGSFHKIGTPTLGRERDGGVILDHEAMNMTTARESPKSMTGTRKSRSSSVPSKARNCKHDESSLVTYLVQY